MFPGAIRDFPGVGALETMVAELRRVLLPVPPEPHERKLRRRPTGDKVPSSRVSLTRWPRRPKVARTVFCCPHRSLLTVVDPTPAAQDDR